MKAVRFDRYGGIEVLQVAIVPTPAPSHGEALVKVKAASINPGEAKIREGLLHAMWPATFPSGEGSAEGALAGRWVVGNCRKHGLCVGACNILKGG